jgi:hypothetical protein
VTLESTPTSDYRRIWFFVLEACGLAVQLGLPQMAVDALALFQKAALSHGAPVDVAPSRVRGLEQDDDGVVGFFVVCFGVLAG